MSLKDVELVARAQDDDQTAFEALVRQYQGKAYAIAYNMCSGDSEEARENDNRPDFNGLYRLSF